MSDASTVMEKDARQWATIIHLSALAGLLGNGVGFVIVPLVIWLLKKNDHPFIDEQGKEAVNFQITMMLAFFVSLVLAIVLIGYVLMAIVGLMAVIFPILAAMKTSEGRSYRYPLSIRVIQ